MARRLAVVAENVDHHLKLVEFLRRGGVSPLQLATPAAYQFARPLRGRAAMLRMIRWRTTTDLARLGITRLGAVGAW